MTSRTPLTVSLAALTLVEGGMGGTETYFREVCRALLLHDDLELLAHVPAGVDLGVPGLPIEAHRAQGWHSSAGRALTTLRLAGDRPGSRSVRRADVVHYPFTVALPRARRTPSVVTLHDVQHLALPENFGALERGYRRLAYDLPARRCDAVITDSEFSRSEIVRYLGVEPQRVHVSYLGVSEAFSPRRATRGRVILYPARRWPHKNHARLIEAVALLRADDPELRLVLTGGGPPVPDAPHWVEQRGMVHQDELIELYATAGCVAFPSLYEGFGLPPLEAMASGCPVAVSQGGALDEVCGESADVFDPTDVNSIARGIARALSASESRVAAGLRRASEFTWIRAGNVHADVYRTVATS